MSTEQKSQGSSRYFSIIDGAFRTQVPSTHPEAVERKWETQDGKSGIKYEREVLALFGKITDIQFHDGEYGKSLNITLDPDEDGVSPVISIGTATRYGEDVLKKLPNIDLSKEVRIRPFSFVGDNERAIKGVEISHQDEEGKYTVKIANFFWDAENKKQVNGYPEVPAESENWDSEDWKIYYVQARKFMVKYAEENVLTKFAHEKGLEAEFERPVGEDDINPEDIPF